ncbi:hypothetical protein CULT_2260001 [[Clostridium] ultunense Esp]|nr:hypothetical protein CULT_2260001 [[Clostridium] ultunense Esp]
MNLLSHLPHSRRVTCMKIDFIVASFTGGIVTFVWQPSYEYHYDPSTLPPLLEELLRGRSPGLS